MGSFFFTGTALGSFFDLVDSLKAKVFGGFVGNFEEIGWCV
jgi:hypothetical protein